MPRLAVYTALTGGYDTLRQPERIREDVDYFCFSNDIHEERIGAWRIRPIPFDDHDPVRVSRFPKLNPHLVLPEFESSLYVDANVRVTKELDEAVNRSIESGTPCAMVPHPDREGTFEEGLFVLRHSMADPFKVYRQMCALAQSEFRNDAGLFVCSIIFRRHLDPRVIAFSEFWWRGFQAGTKRDQLSVMPALAKAELQPDVLVSPGYVLRNTAKHAANNDHSLFWHGWHFAARILLESKLKRIVRQAAQRTYRSQGSLSHDPNNVSYDSGSKGSIPPLG